MPTAEAGNPIQTIVLGTLFGLLLGVGLALVREQSDRKLRRTEQVTAAFDAPVLTTVPRSRALKRNKPFADLPPEVAEAFRMLQMNLRFARDEPVRSVLVTSARPARARRPSPGTWRPPPRPAGCPSRSSRPTCAAPAWPTATSSSPRPAWPRRFRARSRSPQGSRRFCRSPAARRQSATRARCT